MYRPFDVAGQGAVVTGGNGGIGYGTARACPPPTPRCRSGAGGPTRPSAPALIRSPSAAMPGACMPASAMSATNSAPGPGYARPACLFS